MTQITFGSVSSGIEAASVAFDPLGWKSAWFSEIDPFANAVLAHHHPEVTNWQDMRNLPMLIQSGFVIAPDLLCGGTPCQAFSIAGRRESLDDDRGNLTLIFCKIADAIDDQRPDSPCTILWENVPGVLSTKDNAFGHFLAGLVGEEQPLDPAGKRWADAGVVYGPRRSAAWRILDAQYFGLAQRRRRVFVVASARKGFDPAAVLFEWEGLRRDTSPSREAGEDIAPCVTSGASNGSSAHGSRSSSAKEGLIVPAVVGPLMAGCGPRGHGGSGLATDQGAESGHIFAAYGGNRTAGPIDVAAALNAAGGSGRMDFESETFIAHTLRGEGFDASEDGTGRGTPPVACLPFDTTQVTSPGNFSRPKFGDLCHPLTAAGHAPAVAFAVRTANTSANGHGTSQELTHTLDRAQGQAVVAFHHNAQADQLPGASRDTSVSDTLTGSQGAAVAYYTKLHNTSSNQAGKVYREYTTALDRSSPPPALVSPAVRRLTPEECEALQGFPRGYTRIPWSGWRKMDEGETPESCRAEGLAVRQNKKTGAWRVKDVDGPRYKALGNSWAVPCVRWIGVRIAEGLRHAT